MVAAGELGQVTDEVGELLQLHEDVVDEYGPVLGAQFVDAADHLEVRPEAGQRCPQLVRRVEHQLALGAARGLEGLEQSVEGATEAAELVGAAGGEAARDVRRLRHVLHAVGERVQGNEGGARHDPAEHDGQQDTDEGDRAEQQRQRLEL